MLCVNLDRKGQFTRPIWRYKFDFQCDLSGPILDRFLQTFFPGLYFIIFNSRNCYRK
jgi:hypothetical protein